MPGPYFDIYALAASRNAATLEAFLDAYVDRTTAERSIQGLALIMEPLAATGPVGNDECEWVPVASMQEILDWGLSVPPRTFTTYLPWCRGMVKGAILSFTADNQLITGIAVYDDEHGQLVSEETAKVLLQDLMRLVHAHHGLILAEGPPPRTAAEFRVPTRDAAFVLALQASQ
jgi:hypothetical protein